MVKSNLRIQVLGLVLIMATTMLTGCKRSNNTTDAESLSATTTTLDEKDNAGKEESVSETEKKSDINILEYSLDDGESTLADVTYNFGQFQIGGGGFVTGLISCPTEKDLFFARTDVGGAYRWMEETKSWKSLSFGISEAGVT